MTSLLRLVTIGVLTYFFLTLSVQATPPGNVPPNFPDVQLPARSRGEAAISGLGPQLPAIATFYHITAEELQNRLRREPSLWVDEYGRLLYVCEWPKDESAAQPTPLISGGGPLAVSPAGYPYEKTFVLHSRPGSTKTIFLDFDGHRREHMR